MPIFNLSHEEHTLGGAGNVVKNQKLGGNVIALGAVGADPIGKSIVGELDRLGVDGAGVIRGRESWLDAKSPAHVYRAWATGLPP